MQFELKPISKAGIQEALEKAERYRLLAEPSLAESICLDVLQADPENQPALVTLLLALTDQFGHAHAHGHGPHKAREILPRLKSEYDNPDDAFDRVFSSFMFHHLADADKVTTLREVRRVLKPGGRLHLMDFVNADSDSARRGIVRWLHSGPRLKDNSAERILSLMREAGLSDPRRVAGRTMLLGDIAYYQASHV